MRKARMTGRERVNRMFARQEQDSIPRCDTFWKETLERWHAERFTPQRYALPSSEQDTHKLPRDVAENEGFGVNAAARDALQFLGNDFLPLCWSDPQPFPMREDIVAEDEATRTYLDAWGNTVRYWKERSGTPEHVAFGCQTRQQWFEVYKPALLRHPTFVRPGPSYEDWQVGRRNGRWTYLCGLETFEMTRRQVGDETFLMALADDPEWATDMSRTMTDLVLRDFEILLRRGLEPDGVWIYGDMAYRRGPMCSPAMYRELIWPDHRRMAEWAHDHGLPFIFHTDGDVNCLIPHYLDAGFDCLQPLEAKAGMDVREMAPKYGDRLALFGNIDVMVMATNDRDLIEHEVRTKLAAGMETGGYVYHSDHSVPPTTSWDTYCFIVDLIDTYGNYD